MDDGLPYVDEHTVTVAAPRDRVWGELLRYVNESLATSRDHPLARVLGASPRSGFRVTGAEAGERLALAGRHRFSRYALVFALDEQSAGVTLLRATTHAAFPGLHGTLYRTLVVGTRVHALVTRRMLETVRKASEGAT
jgi:hypothetical protein